MKEIWKDIPGYQGKYQVSNFGDVKSLNYNHSGKERILKPGLRNVYLAVDLSKNGKRKSYYIHQLVATVFLGHTSDGHNIEIDHIDRNKLNNKLFNLQLLNKQQHSNKDLLGSGIGCSWNKLKNKWQSQIKINTKAIHLGYFTDKQDAIDMYQKALANIHLYNGDNKAFRLALATVTL